MILVPVVGAQIVWASRLRATVLQTTFRFLALLILAALLGACATAPGTGRTFFTGGLTPDSELRLGAEQHPRMLEEFGGSYDDRALQLYVSSIGELLASTSELPGLKFTFTVLDSPIVNAFALPGGYVYVSRGLLALAQNEAQLAGVLAHEIGHVTARHSAERHGQATLANLATAGLGILAGGTAANLGSGLGALVLSSYSRDQELEADTLGVRYLSRAGYDTQEMAGFLRQMGANSRLQAKIAGKGGGRDETSLLSTHPRTADRVQQAIRAAQVRPVQAPITARPLYLKKIDGLIFGDNPDQGLVKGDRFIHPKLRFEFRLPKGFQVRNSPNQLVAYGSDGAFFVFDGAPKDYRGSMANYLSQVWGKNVGLRDVEQIEINGLPAAAGAVRLDTKKGPRDFRAVAIRMSRDRIYRLLFVSAPKLTAKYAKAFRRTTYSFQRISAAEAAGIKAERLRIHTVQPGESARSLARTFPAGKHRLDLFSVLNGLGPSQQIRPGDQVKLISE